MPIKLAEVPILARVSLTCDDTQRLPVGSAILKQFIDDTLPGDPVKRTIKYIALFFKPSRENDYRRAWVFLQRGPRA